VNSAADRARDVWASARPALDRWRVGVPTSGATPALQEAWQAVTSVLNALYPEVPSDDAKALVGALRRDGLCTLDEAHALIDLRAAAEREGSVASGGGDLHRDLVLRAADVMERVVQTADDSVNAAPLYDEYRRASSRTVPPDVPIDRTPPGTQSPPREPASGHRASSSSASAHYSDASVEVPAPSTSRNRSNMLVVSLVVVCLVAAGLAAFLFDRVGSRDAVANGVEAYEAGQRVVARLEFERALADDPGNARALVYLGRLSREEGDLAQARRLLEQAVQRAPDNPLTHRELASALLADGQPELARRFYVRALTLDPTDRLAQGFLGCSLARLGRADEARRWLDRAGPGDWTACATTLLPARPPGMP
jgi:tetratricopeptide (TPR) repeat protein